MPTESSPDNGFIHRHGPAVTFGVSVAAIALLVLIYRTTTPRSVQDTTASGDRVSESEVLQVGALPVT